ncbi:serine hydrolase [Streptomyces netropsis]|uniref:serine hydrolase n=1 Tax=Streptomyces netropsis TaxID=55404 RepID=UPI0030D4D8B8
MSRHRIPTPARGALSAALAVGVLVPPVVGAAPAAAATPRVSCTSDKDGLAAKLSKDITAALSGRSATTAVSLRDQGTNTVCTLRDADRFDSASTVKVTVLAALLWDAKKTERRLTERESGLATAMITKSDNDATSALWKQLGASKVKAFLKAAGMSRTVPGDGGYWGLTQITAGDEQKLMDHLVPRPGQKSVLSEAARAYILKLMGMVIPSQRWGTSAGAPSTVKIQVKNGWLSRATHGWRVHSLGAFTGGGRNYTMTVLTHDNRTMDDGVATIQAVAKAIHKNLNPATLKASGTYAPTRSPQEIMPPLPRG